jgi:PAS domain S-box-containing protein
MSDKEYAALTSDPTRGSAGTRGATELFSGPGEVRALARQLDWSSTPLGSPEAWSPALRTVARSMFDSPFPICLWSGPQYALVYNDAYRRILAAKHPRALGQPGSSVWSEIWEELKPQFDQVRAGGAPIYFENAPFVMARLEGGGHENAWFNYSLSALRDEDGSVAAVLNISPETTAQVTAERRLAGERDRLAHLFDKAPAFMAMLTGPKHVFEMANPAYVSLVGSRDVMGAPIAEVLPEALEQGYVDLLDRVYRTGDAYRGTGARLVLRSTSTSPGRDIFRDFVYQPMTNDEGAVTGIFVSGVDVTERAAAQAALSASEMQFRTFAQAAPNHIWTARPDGLLDWFNDQALTYTGLGQSDLAGAGWTEVIHPDERDAIAQRWAASIASGETYETEFRIRRADGAFRWHLVRALPIRDAQGAILRWLGTNTDIHEQKISHAESAADRDRLWALSQDLMLVCTFEGVITAVNPSATRMLGWERQEMVGRSLDEFIHPDDAEATAAEVVSLRQGRTTLAFENRYRTKAGDYRLLAWTAVPDQGRIHAVGRDLTEERRLARDRERIWTLSPVLKVVSDQRGVITDVNPSWTTSLGWTREETIGRRTTDFMVDDEESWTERVRTLAAGHPLPDYRTTVRAKDGQYRIIRWTSMPENETFYGFGRDITAEVEAEAALAETEAALRQSQKMEAVGQLTGGIAHDFNNLLQGITGSLEVLQRRVAQGRISDLERFITGASTAANRAAALTHRLLAFSRRQPLDPKPVRANTLVASMEDLLRRTIGERVQLELVLSGGLWITRCDPNQLESAILNLVINARDAMPDGGKLTIETCNAHLDSAYAARQRGVKPGQYVCICVTDTGTGMDADTMARAFEPFFTTKPIGQGTGLGLSMIYGFAQQSEGYAKIYSEVGTGTTLKLYLPRYRGSADTEDTVPQLTNAHTADDGEVVLVVEDEPIVRGLIVDQLQELGYVALEAVDGPKGLEVLQSKRRIDLLITDMGLPGLNGRQVADAARDLRPNLKVLFMTGYAENAALASGFLEPGMEMITKPFAMEALATRIRTMIEGSPAIARIMD